MLPAAVPSDDGHLRSRGPRFDQETRGYRCVPRQMRGDKSSNRSTSNSIVRVDTAFPSSHIPDNIARSKNDLSSIDRFRSVYIQYLRTGDDTGISYEAPPRASRVYHSCTVSRLIDDNKELVVSRVCRSRLRSIIFRFYLFIVYNIVPYERSVDDKS